MFGDRATGVTSNLVGATGPGVYMIGNNVDKNSLGVSLVYGKKLSNKSSLDFTYHGVYGSKVTSNAFRVDMNFKF